MVELQIVLSSREHVYSSVSTVTVQALVQGQGSRGALFVVIHSYRVHGLDCFNSRKMFVELQILNQVSQFLWRGSLFYPNVKVELSPRHHHLP